MNIVRINEAIFKAFQAAYAADNTASCGFCWKFTYARKDYANLKDKDCSVNVYMEEFATETIYGSDGMADYIQHTFTLKILLDSLLDIQIFNELDPDEQKSKFAEYVEPIIDCFPINYNSAICDQGLSLMRTRIKALYNKKDQNQDGISFYVVAKEEC